MTDLDDSGSSTAYKLRDEGEQSFIFRNDVMPQEGGPQRVSDTS